MFNKFYPDGYYSSTYKIDFKKEYENGIRGILFDIDNTLVEHGQDATKESDRLINYLKETGFDVCLISNNKKERVDRFNKNVKVHAIHKANKPSTKNYVKAMELMGTKKDTTLFVGDQLFTDVYGAKRAGIKAYMVKQIAKHEEIQIVFKRKLEKIVLHFYFKDKNNTQDVKNGGKDE